MHCNKCNSTCSRSSLSFLESKMTCKALIFSFNQCHYSPTTGAFWSPLICFSLFFSSSTLQLPVFFGGLKYVKTTSESTGDIYIYICIFLGAASFFCLSFGLAKRPYHWDHIVTLLRLPKRFSSDHLFEMTTDIDVFLKSLL